MNKYLENLSKITDKLDIMEELGKFQNIKQVKEANKKPEKSN
jgi:hypothetical protein